jgi:Rieske Fe-S protein
VSDRCLTRRRALGVAALGGGAPILAACGGDESSPTAGGTTSDSAATTTAPAEPTESSPVAPRDGGGDPLVATGEVPLAGGVILAKEQVVVTQPTEGEFKAFTAVCTHAGCVVAQVESDIMCECHGSRFALADGAVVQGPATAPLPAVDVRVRDGQVVRA